MYVDAFKPPKEKRKDQEYRLLRLRHEIVTHDLQIRAIFRAIPVPFNLMVIRRKVVFIVRHVLVTGIVLVRPSKQRVPIATDSRLASRTIHTVVPGRRWEEKIVSVTHCVLAHMIHAVHRMTDVARQRPAMVRIVEKTMNIFLNGINFVSFEQRCWPPQPTHIAGSGGVDWK